MLLRNNTDGIQRTQFRRKTEKNTVEGGYVVEGWLHNNVKVKSKSSMYVLGIHIDSRLQWTEQVSMMISMHAIKLIRKLIEY